MAGPSASVGAQLITPVFGSMVMPAGAEGRLKVRVLAGKSESVALADTLRAVCSLIVWLAGTVSNGALFTSLIMTTKVFVVPSAGDPSSVTITCTRLLLGPWAS